MKIIYKNISNLKEQDVQMKKNKHTDRQTDRQTHRGKERELNFVIDVNDQNNSFRKK